MSKAKTAYVGIVLLILIGATAYYMYPSQTAELTEETSKSFASSQFGISFLYPSYYGLRQENVGPEAPVHHRITLQKAAVAATPSISIDIYENDHQYASAQEFIDANPDSDIKLATSSVTPLMVAQEPALSYRSTGLYESFTVVIKKTGYVYMLRVSGGQEQPGLDADFERILATLKVTEIKDTPNF